MASLFKLEISKSCYESYILDLKTVTFFLQKGSNVFKRDTKGKFVYRAVFDSIAAGSAKVRIQKEINELQENRASSLKRSPRPTVNPIFYFIPILLCCLILFIVFNASNSKGSSITPLLLYISGVLLVISGLGIGFARWFNSPNAEKWEKTTGVQIKSFDLQIASKKAEFQQAGLSQRNLYRFYSGKTYSVREWEEEEYQEFLKAQQYEPRAIMEDANSRKKWWMFKNEFYCEDENFTSADIKVLILERIEKRKARIERAQARLLPKSVAQSTLREPISDDVKMFVWQRDGGKCVKCGSQIKLEYDHIIPIAKGGSNTARNIQLLCEKCNREKGANLF